MCRPDTQHTATALERKHYRNRLNYLRALVYLPEFRSRASKIYISLSTTCMYLNDSIRTSKYTALDFQVDFQWKNQ